MENNKLTLIQKIGLIFCGIFISLIIIELGLRLTGWIYFVHDSLKNKVDLEKALGKNTIRILCLGPCYTVGVGVSPEETYPIYLERILKEQYPDKAFVVFNKGVRGKNLFFFVEILDKFIVKYQPQIAILNINARIDIYDESFILAIKGLYSNYNKVELTIRAFLKKFKIYQILELMFIPKKHTLELEPRKERMFLKEFSEINKESLYGSEIAALEAQLEVNPINEQKWKKLAHAYAMQGIYDSAIEAVEKAIEINPKNGWNYLYLFWYYCYLGKYELAIKMQKKALEVDPHLIELISKKIENLEKQVNLDSSDNLKLRLLFQYYINLGEYKKAMDLADKYMKKNKGARERKPRHLRVLIKLARYLNKNETYSELSDDKSYYKDKISFKAFKKKAKKIFKEKGMKFDPKALSGSEIFSWLLRYNLTNLKKIAESHNIMFVLENMGSSSEQQKIVRELCAELDIMLVDLYAFFENRPDHERFFLPYPHNNRLNKEGNRLMAYEIYKTLVKNNFLSRIPVKSCIFIN